MKLDDWIEILEKIRVFMYQFALEYNVYDSLYLDLTGGEPFVHKDFKQFITHVGKQDWLIYGIMTNGSLIGNAEAYLLKKTGCDRVQVSLDGTEKNHDYLRGKGNFNMVLDKINLMKKHGLYVMVSFTATTENYHDFPELARIVNEVGADCLWSDRVLPIDTDKDVSHLIMNSEQTKEYFRIMQSTRNEMNESRNNLEIRMHRALQFLHGGGSPYTCIAGTLHMAMLPNGDILPCRRMPIKIGNIKEMTFWEAMHSEIVKKIHSHIPEGCNGCRYVNTCKGGLKCLCHATTGNPNSGDDGCWLKEKKYD